MSSVGGTGIDCGTPRARLENRPAKARSVFLSGYLIRLLASAAIINASVAPAFADSLPQGGSVAAGSVSISTPSATQMNINQSSQNAVVNWNSFNVGAGSRVDINQPNSSSALLNRVTGSTTSTIAGQINANGQVYLVNPNGITITKSGAVKAGGGFVASSLGISDSDFMEGKRTFKGEGAPVTNHGRISVGRGGYAALIGSEVSNTGTISVPMGKVGLGSGQQATLDLSGDGFLQVAVPAKNGSVSNSGRIRANGGLVEMRAAAARDAARNVVNMSGVIQARSVGGRSGRVVLGGGGGGVRVTGKIDASARATRVARANKAGRTQVASLGKGGSVEITGGDIALSGANINVSGVSGGGTVKIGGDYQGSGSIPHAMSVAIDKATTINADAIESGNGGRVIIWSDERTTFDGLITAKGGSLSGNGGEAEVSSKGQLVYSGFANLSAANGSFGTLLLDPYNITISNAADSSQTGFTATGDNSIINVTTLINQLAGANVEVKTGAVGSPGAQAGTITVADALTWSAATTLTLTAASNIAINAAITATNGGLTVTSGGAISATGGIDVGTYIQTAGAFSQIAATLPTFTAKDFQLQGGTFVRATGGNGVDATTPYVLTDVYGLQGMSTLRFSSFALGSDINASGTATWNGNAGFVPIGVRLSEFVGNFDGRGRTITGLTINRPTTDGVGLFGETAGLANGTIGKISNVRLADVSIKGNLNVGGLAGSAVGNVIQGISVAGSVSGSEGVGGLVGLSFGATVDASTSAIVINSGLSKSVGGLVGISSQGTVKSSTFTGSVTGGDNTGGIVGLSELASIVALSTSTGSVTGVNSVGGLVGYNKNSTVETSSASGAVTGGNDVGGLVGQSSGQVKMSHASGQVSGVTNVGGLVGNNLDSVQTSYATGPVSGDANVGGLVGQNFKGTVQASFAMGSVTGNSAFGGLVGLNELGTVRTSYATGFINGSAGRGLIGLDNQGTLSSLYFNTETAGVGDNGDGTGRTTAQLQSGTLPVGFDPAIWGTGAGLYPYLKLIFPSGVQAVSGFAFGDVSASTVIKGAQVGVVANGNSFERVTTGANGYYYAFGAAGSAASGQSLLAYMNANSAQGVANAAVLTTATGASNQTGVNIFNDVLTTTTTSFFSSQLPSLAGLKTAFAAEAGGNTFALSAINGASGRNFDAIRPFFTFDEAFTIATGESFYLRTTGSANQQITVGKAITVDGTGKLGLFANGGLQVNAPITVTGAGSVAMSAEALPGISTTGLVFGVGASVDYATTTGSFQLNGESYTLIHNLQQLQAMNQNLAGRYALAANIDASASAALNNGAGFAPVGDGTTAFTGRFDGLGHTIAALTINRLASDFVGLFGSASGSTISNVGLIGGSITGKDQVGSLAGQNVLQGVVQQSYSSAAVTGGQSVGGLVGSNTGTVQVTKAMGAVAGNKIVGGLVGSNTGTIQTSLAMGTVTGTVDGTGGLVGLDDRGLIQSTYATGAVRGVLGVGGLVGLGTGGSILYSYATGAVSGTGLTGGLIGGTASPVSVVNSYFDTETTGRGSVAGVGLTTAELQGTTPLANGEFITDSKHLGSQFSGGNLSLYPYLTALFPNGVRAVSGIAYSDGGVTPLASNSNGAVPVSVLANGTLQATATTGANGYYYAFAGADVFTGDNILAFTTANANTGAKNAVSFLSNASAFRVEGLDISGGWQRDVTALGSLSSLNTAFAAAAGTSAAQFFNLGNRQITATGALFNFDQALTLPGTLAVKGKGPVVQTSALAASSLSLDGGSYVLTNVGNDFGIVAANAQSLSLRDANAITIGSVGDAQGGTIDGITATGPVAVTAAGNIEIAAGAPISASSITLASGGAFINNQGASALAANGGRWLVYSAAVAGNTFGGLDSGNTAIWATAPGAIITATGNRYVFAEAPTLTFTSQSRQKTYGDVVDVSGAFAVSGLHPGVVGAFLPDTLAAVVSGNPLVTSAGAAATAGVAGSPYDITVSQGTLSSLAGYTLSFANTGKLQVAPRGITVTAVSGASAYGDVPLNPGLSAQGLQNNEDANVVLTGLSNSFGITGATTVGSTTLNVVGNLTNPNYTVTATVNGTWIVNPRDITVVADNKSRPFGLVNPPLTFTVGSAGLVNGDQLTGALATTAVLGSLVGTYPITQGTLAASNTYRMTFVPGTFTVTTPVPSPGTAASQIDTSVSPWPNVPLLPPLTGQALRDAVGGNGPFLNVRPLLCFGSEETGGCLQTSSLDAAFAAN